MRLERIVWAEAETPDAEQLRDRLAAEGFSVFEWRDGPDSFYALHSHSGDESLWVVEGQIVFEIGGETHRLGRGDRLMLPAGTVHAARVGPRGCTYLIGERHASRMGPS